jgi:nucleotide-binding universal stress UspA family protein
LKLGSKHLQRSNLIELRQQKISKILVAVDGSEESMLAADCTIDMAKKNNAELIILNVIHSQKYLYLPAYAWRPVIPSTTNSIIKNQEEEAQRWLAIVREKANNNKIMLRTEFIIDPMSIVGAIVDYVERENIDLLVIGSRGLTGFKKLLIGSVASGVVTYAHCPVMVVK